MAGVGDLPPSMSQSVSGDMMTGSVEPTSSNNIMSQSMMVPSTTSPLNDKHDPMSTSTSSLNFKSGKKYIPNRNQISQIWFAEDDADSLESRADIAAKEKEREERVRRLKEQQEDDRRKKLEELKQHALHAQKFREQQEIERRRHIEQLRMKDMDRRLQVEERRKEIEKSELERKEAIIQKNKERETRLENQRRSSRSNIDFAFGSSAPRMMEPRVDSASGYWGTRSVSGQTMFERSNVSMEREVGASDLRSKRTASAHGLNMSTDGEDGVLSPNITAHRRRTDLVPTIVMPRPDRQPGHVTPGSRHRSPGRTMSMSRIDAGAWPGDTAPVKTVSSSKSMTHLAVSSPQYRPRRHHNMLKTNSNTALNRVRPRPRPRTLEVQHEASISRENSTASAGRPGSAMSGAAAGNRTMSGVRMRSTPTRRPRPMSIATTGMTSSMYEERQKPNLTVRDKSLNTPKADRVRRARSITSDSVAGDNDETRSNSSVGARTPSRKTPSMVKEKDAARKAKASTPKLSSAHSKSSLNNVSNGTKEATKSSSKTPSPAMSQDNIEISDSKRRQSTPDIIKDNNRKIVDNSENNVANNDDTDNKTEDNENNENSEVKEPKKIITSEEEAKARIAEKRREMKEQKEREAELERLRLEEEARQEAERLRQEEEEEKRLIALEQEARRAEEERIRKAIEEKEAEDRKKKEEEERLRAEKEEMEKKVKAEAERREAELQEKLKKEEEERLARKKRIEEIMARTRKGTATPKKEEKEEETPAPTESTSQPQEQPQEHQQPPSLDTNVDPTKPDLLGDISDKVEENNAKNLAHSNGTSATEESQEIEKGALDSISSKSDENENSSPLITLDNGEAPVKKLNGLVEGTSFDQILDLGTVPDSNKSSSDHPPTMMAFEESIQQQTNNTADLLS